MVVVALLLAACGGDDSSSVPLATTTSSVLASVPHEFDTSPVTSAAVGRGLLADVRVGVHDEGFVRVTFEFDALPGYRVAFTERPITQDGSGDEVALAGSAALLVRMEPASSFDLEASKATYTGPKRIATSSEAAPEVVFVGDFEAVLAWAIGLDKERPFRAFTLASPARLVVDIATED